MLALSRLFRAGIKAFTHLCLVGFSSAVLDDIDFVWLPSLIVLLYEVVVAFVFGWTHGLGSRVPFWCSYHRLLQNEEE